MHHVLEKGGDTKEGDGGDEGQLETTTPNSNSGKRKIVDHNY